MRDVAKYKHHAKECRDLAARMTRPNERKILEDIADLKRISGLCYRDLKDEGAADAKIFVP
jgi:hypothetical protein